MRRPFYRKHFKQKNVGVQRQFLGQFPGHVLLAKLNGSVEAATNSYSATGHFLWCIYQNHQNFWSRFLLYGFSFTNILKRIFVMVTEHLYWRKYIYDCFCSFFNWDSFQPCWAATVTHGVTRKRIQKG